MLERGGVGTRWGGIRHFFPRWSGLLGRMGLGVCASIGLWYGEFVGFDEVLGKG